MANKNTALIVILVIIGVIVAFQFLKPTTTTTPAPTNGLPSVGTCEYQPTGAYSVKDSFSSTSPTGTGYYKQDGLSITTTALTNLNKDTSYKYWLQNDSGWFVQPVEKVATCGVTPFIAPAWQNASASVSGYDTLNSQSVAGGVYNTSMPANGNANIKITYQGTSKKSAAPFGGLMVVEYNSTIASVSCTGNEIVANPGYHLTYTVSATNKAYAIFGFTNKLDDGTGNAKFINCQFSNGGSAAGAGAVYYVKFIPANYYVTNAGDLALDTEKQANADNTRTAFGYNPTLTAYWGA